MKSGVRRPVRRARRLRCDVPGARRRPPERPTAWGSERCSGPETLMTGRRPACSEPTTGFRFTSHTSPGRSGSLIRRATRHSSLSPIRPVRRRNPPCLWIGLQPCVVLSGEKARISPSAAVAQVLGESFPDLFYLASAECGEASAPPATAGPTVKCTASDESSPSLGGLAKGRLDSLKLAPL
jgi:hypothetical protein